MNLLRYISAVLTVALFLGMAPASHAADRLVWKPGADKIEADIDGWSLEQLLKKISSVAGWEIYLEPGTTRDVSVKFGEVPVDEGLKRLLGKLNYALLPQTNAPPKFYVFRTTLGQATQLIGGKPAAEVRKSRHLIPNELIVTLAPNATMTIEELAKLLGAKITGRADALRTYRLQFASEADALAAREKLRDISSVESVDSNFSFDPPIPGATAPISSSNEFPLKPTAKGDPNNLIVGLIDTAVQPLGENLQGFVLPGISVAKGEFPNNSLSHGTSMAQSLLQAMAVAESDAGSSKVKILPVDVYGDRGATTTYDVARGVYEAINNGAMIVNLSLGTSGDSTFLQSVIREGRRQGVLFFAAAGNEPTSTPTYPAAYPDVIAVTAGRNGELAPYANYGSFVDILTPGSALVKFDGKSYIVGGTSVASAHAAGIAAGTADISRKTPTQIEAIIREGFAFTPVTK